MPEKANPVSKKIQEAFERSQKKERPEWAKKLFTMERAEKLIAGELTLAEYNGIQRSEMVAMASTAFSMFQNGRYREATTLFSGLAALDPKESYFRTGAGAALLAQNQLDEALVEFDAAIRINERDLAAHVNRGEVYLRQGKVQEAADDFQRAVQLDPDKKDPLSNRARLLAAAALELVESQG